jgi:hypothetical protein
MRGFKEELIAQCGMNCGICTSYLAYINKVPKKKGGGGIHHCVGCRIKNSQCVVKKRCISPKKKEIDFCFECDVFPCDPLRKLDARYRKNYNMSEIDNLNEIKRSGMKKFLNSQYKKYKCPKCGGLICVHSKSGKCYKCDKVKSWKE